MGKTVTIEVPDELYAILERQAREAGRPLQEFVLAWMTSHTQARRSLSPEEMRKRSDWLNALPKVTARESGGGADHESIERDLAREYGSAPEGEP